MMPREGVPGARDDSWKKSHVQSNDREQRVYRESTCDESQVSTHVSRSRLPNLPARSTAVVRLPTSSETSEYTEELLSGEGP
jgi:hypothetical protein